MFEMSVRQPGFKFLAQEIFTKDKTKIQKLKETEGSRYELFLWYG